MIVGSSISTLALLRNRAPSARWGPRRSRERVARTVDLGTTSSPAPRTSQRSAHSENGALKWVDYRHLFVAFDMTDTGGLTRRVFRSIMANDCAIVCRAILDKEVMRSKIMVRTVLQTLCTRVMM